MSVQIIEQLVFFFPTLGEKVVGREKAAGGNEERKPSSSAPAPDSGNGGDDSWQDEGWEVSV